MSDPDSDQTQASSQLPQFTSRRQAAFAGRRRADATLKDQEAVRDYLTFKQTKGLMTESEKRLLDKIAAVCGMTSAVNDKAVSGRANAVDGNKPAQSNPAKTSS